jgi:hypothetical protein
MDSKTSENIQNLRIAQKIFFGTMKRMIPNPENKPAPNQIKF